jgi:hypothetical protein
MKAKRYEFAIGLTAVALLSLSACEKKLELNATESKLQGRELAVTQRAADNTLAYEHEVSLQVDRGQISRRVDAMRAACFADTKSACTILEASVNDAESYANGQIKMRLAPTGVDALVNAASVDAQVTARKTSAEDLAQPLADVARQVSMLNSYRDRLMVLLTRKDLNATDLIALSKELATTQVQIEALASQNMQLHRRLDTDLLTIVWHIPAAQARSAASPVRDALREFGANFRAAIGNVIEFLAQLVPWLVVGLPSLVLLRMFWRWTGIWLGRKARLSEVQR